MNKKTTILIALITMSIGGCTLDRTGNKPVPSNPAQVYYWYADGNVSRGSSTNPVAYPVNNQDFYSYAVPTNRQIIAVGIAKNDRVYYWYDNNTTSIGTTREPTKYRVSYPSNRDTNRELIGVGIAGNDRVYYWYSGGTTGRVSIGTSDNPTIHSKAICPNNNGFCEADIIKGSRLMEPIATAIDGFYDTVFYWYPDQTVSSGSSTDATKYRDYSNSNLNKEIVGIAIRNGK